MPRTGNVAFSLTIRGWSRFVGSFNRVEPQPIPATETTPRAVKVSIAPGRERSMRAIFGGRTRFRGHRKLILSLSLSLALPFPAGISGGIGGDEIRFPSEVSRGEACTVPANEASFRNLRHILHRYQILWLM